MVRQVVENQKLAPTDVLGMAKDLKSAPEGVDFCPLTTEGVSGDHAPGLCASVGCLKTRGDGSKPWFFAGLSFRQGGSDQFLFLEGDA